VGELRLGAYVLAADPHFVAASVRAYLPLVERLVVSFDRHHRSWAGHPLDVERCLAEVAAVDDDGKAVLVPGDFSHPGRPALDCDTAQRQAALEAVGGAVDWVLQIDSDEVIPHQEPFLAALQQADGAGMHALDYPSRWLWARLGPRRYLEGSGRWGRPSMSFPGPLAVRPGTVLSVARQTQAPRWRVDVAPAGTDPWQPPGTPVDALVEVAEAVLHFSWVRSQDALQAKARTSGHADDFDWAAALAQRERAMRRPHLYQWGNPVRRSTPWNGRWARVVTLAVDPPALVTA
jgi:hypothetical protein